MKYFLNLTVAILNGINSKTKFLFGGYNDGFFGTIL